MTNQNQCPGSGKIGTMTLYEAPQVWTVACSACHRTGIPSIVGTEPTGRFIGYLIKNHAR